VRDNGLIVLLDVLAVNLSYFLALIIRFYVNQNFRPTVLYYVDCFTRFAPFYTVLAIAVFVLFKLYSGVWQYAGLNDLNRLFLANLCTLVIQVAGSIVSLLLLPDSKASRMPFSYYLIGSVLQFSMMALTRFVPKLMKLERKRLENQSATAVPTMIIGAGQMCHRILRNLDDGSPFKVSVLLDDYRAGKTFDGLPVVGGSLADALEKHGIKVVFLANPRLSQDERTAIQSVCKERDVRIIDYTGNLTNAGGGVSLTALLDVTRGPVVVRAMNAEKTYASAEEAQREIVGQFEVVEVSNLTVTLKRHSDEAFIGHDAWVQQYKQETGQDLSFF
jgi:FlaA1/EpsC-like NDP-sugar epimerase